MTELTKALIKPSMYDELNYPGITKVYEESLDNLEIHKIQREIRRENNKKRKRHKLLIRTINVLLAMFYALCIVCMILGFIDFLRFIGGCL